MVAFPGNWYRVASPSGPPDPIALDENNKERVRILLGRYGILFRELLLREESAFQWSALFRTMRLMELSGELVTGYFFEGIPGPQFASPATVEALQQPLDTEAAYWLNAADPLSLAGVALTEGRAQLPRRHPTTHFAACGPEILMHSERQGAELTFRIPPDDPRLVHCFGVLSHLLRRRANPLSRIEVTRINGAPAASSPFADWLRDSFETIADWHKLILLRA